MKRTHTKGLLFSICCAASLLASPVQAEDTVRVPRNPKIATTGKAVFGLGLLSAGIGTPLVVAAWQVDGDKAGGYAVFGKGALMVLPAAMTLAGGGAVITGAIMWAVGGSTVERDRIRILSPGVAIGPNGVSAKWRF